MAASAKSIEWSHITQSRTGFYADTHCSREEPNDAMTHDNVTTHGAAGYVARGCHPKASLFVFFLCSQIAPHMVVRTTGGCQLQTSKN